MRESLANMSNVETVETLFQNVWNIFPQTPDFDGVDTDPESVYNGVIPKGWGTPKDCSNV